MTTKAASGHRFWSKVQRSDGCWIWTGRLDRDGYGKFKAGGGP